LPEPAASSDQHASPFHIPLFRAVWISSLCSNIGSLVQATGASWMMTDLGASSRMVALVQTANTLPIMLLALWAGAVADNLDRRRIMLACQAFMLVVSALLAVAAWMGGVTPWLLLAVTFLIGCGSAVNGPAWQASVGDMVPMKALPRAIADNSVGFNVARSLGPAAGGLIVAAAGAATAFLLNALSYIGLIVVLARWHRKGAESKLPREPLGHAMAEGVRYVSLSPPLLRIILRATLFGLPATALASLMPIVARETLHGGALIYGLLLGAFGVGSVAGAWLGTQARNRLSAETTIRVAATAVAAGSAVAAVSPSLLATLFILLVAGAGWVVALSTFNIMVQLASPRWIVARVIAIYQMCSFGGMAVGSWLFGGIADGHGVAAGLLAAAALQILGVLCGVPLPLPAIGKNDDEPKRGETPPAPMLTVDERSGPVVVTREMQVPATRAEAFSAAMQERRRMRLLNGAQGWSLMRDADDTAVWVERYQFATWADYLRYSSHLTQAEDEDAPRIAKLIETGSKPEVTRVVASNGPRARSIMDVLRTEIGHQPTAGAPMA
jgi:MFS family permease